MDKKRLVFYSAVAVLVILWFVSHRSSPGVRGPGNPTTYDNGAMGYRAFYLLMEKLGHRPVRIEEKETRYSSIAGGVAIIIRPYPNYLDQDKARDLLDWVARGNSLIVADSDENIFWRSLGLRLLETEKLTERVSPARESPLSRGVGMVSVKGHWRFVLPPEQFQPFTVHLEDGEGVILASTPVGKGQVYVLSTPQLFCNGEIDRDDNVILMANLIREAGRDGVVAFDETIHGFSRDTGPFRFSGVQQGIMLQLGLVLILFYAVYMKRFGIPRHHGEDLQRSSIEYLHSLAGLFQKAGASRYVLENCYRDFLEQTGSLTGHRYSHRLDQEHLLEGIRRKNPRYEKEARRLMERVEEGLKGGNIDTAGLVILAGEMDRFLSRLKQPEGGGKIE